MSASLAKCSDHMWGAGQEIRRQDKQQKRKQWKRCSDGGTDAVSLRAECEAETEQQEEASQHEQKDANHLEHRLELWGLHKRCSFVERIR